MLVYLCLQDLKDHMRPAGDVGFSEVIRERGEVRPCDKTRGSVCADDAARFWQSGRVKQLPKPSHSCLFLQIVGIVEYGSREDMEKALSTLDGSKFK